MYAVRIDEAQFLLLCLYVVLVCTLLLLLVKLLVYAVRIDEVSLIDEVQFVLMKCSSCCFACMQ